MSLSQEQKQEKEQQQVATRGKRPRVLVSLEDKDRAIARIRNGETKAGISRELGVPESTVRGWVKRAEQRLAKEADMLAAAANADDPNNIPTMSNGQPSSRNSINSNKVASVQVADVQPSKRHCTGISSMPRHIWATPQPASYGDCHNDNTDHNPCVLAWLKLFNDGLLNFTYIVTAAVIQSQFRENCGEPLWKIVDNYIEERGILSCLQYSNIQNNWANMFTSPLMNLPAATTVQQLTPMPMLPTPSNELSGVTKSLAKATVTHPLPFHVTASDDDDNNGTENDSEDVQMTGNMDTD